MIFVRSLVAVLGLALLTTASVVSVPVRKAPALTTPVPVAPTASATTRCPKTAIAIDFKLPHTRAALNKDRRLVIVAIGSSSTEGSQASTPEHAYPAMLRMALVRALPGIQVEVYNKGIGGQDAADTLARFDRDVIANHPALVIWQVGANGALRDADPAVFRALVGKGVDQLNKAGIDVVLMDNQRAPLILRHERRVAIELALAQQAVSSDVGLFPRGALMDNWAASGHPNQEFLAADGLHHNDLGYECVADALSTAILAGLSRPLMVSGGH